MLQQRSMTAFLYWKNYQFQEQFGMSRQCWLRHYTDINRIWN